MNWKRLLAALLLPMLLLAVIPAGATPTISPERQADNAPIIPSISGRARQIYRAGQRLGNRRDVFSKVGDSITATPQFLWQVGVGGLHLEGYNTLQPTVDFFMTTPARDANSFSNSSLAAQPNWTTYSLLDPNNAPDDLCTPEESPLACEYRVVRPSVALIMIGTNDIMQGVDSEAYRANLNTIVQTSIDMGVIPVLSTLPDNLADAGWGGRVHEFNNIIISVARTHNIPLWNYWRALQPLPNRGISGDNIHPSHDPSGEAAIFTPEMLGAYGYTVRNLTALQVLNAVRQAALR